MLNPNATYDLLGVTVREKIIPDGTRWKDGAKAAACGFSQGSLYKKQKPLCGTGKAKSVTVHNTDDLPKVLDDAEQYVRATYNENMKEIRVHFYVDEQGAWQEMKAGTGMTPNDPEGSAEVTWHAGDGSTADGGNMTSLSMEIIMKDNAENDAKAMDNGARLAAWLLLQHGLTIDDLVTHTYWVNKKAGKKFANVDEQCCTPVPGKKWCPAYIFGSSNKDTALKNWKKFKALVKSYLDDLCAGPEEDTATTAPVVKTIEEGDVVAIADNAYYWGGHDRVPAWVRAKKWIVREINGNRAVIDKSVDGHNAICSPIHVKYLTADAPYVPKEGDVVNFVGDMCYTRADGKGGMKCKPGKARITSTYGVGEQPYPYHLVAEKNGGSNVYGWCAAEDITKA